MEVGRWEGTPSRVTLKGTDFFSFLCVLMPGWGVGRGSTDDRLCPWARVPC